MPLNIPLPGDPGENLVGASQDLRNIFQQIMQNRTKQQELAETGRYHTGSLAQQAKELAETTKYHKALTDIQRAESQRKSSKDAMAQQIFNEINGRGNPNQQGMSGQPVNQQPYGNNSSGQNYQQTDKDNFMELMSRVNSPNRSTQKDKQRDRDNFIELMNRRNMGNQSAQQNGYPQQQQMNQQQMNPMQNLQNMQQRLNSGEEVVFRKGDESRSGWNKYPGYEKYGIKIPNIRTENINGIRYDTYPNGEVRARKLLDQDEKMSSEYGKAIEDANKILKKYGKDSDEYKDAKEYAKRKAEGNGMSLEVDPKTGMISFSQGGRGGKQTSQIVNGKYVSTPTSATTTAQQNSSMANQSREIILKNVNNPYIGTGSNMDILNDRANYDTEKDIDKKKQIGKRLVDAAVSKMLVPEAAGLQLKSQGIQSTIPALMHQQEVITQGWPMALNKIVDNLPKELQKQAKEEHSKRLKEIVDARNKFYAEGFPIDTNKKDNTESDSEVVPVRDNLTGKITKMSRSEFNKLNQSNEDKK